MTALTADFDQTRSVYAAFVTSHDQSRDLSAMVQLVAAMLRDQGHATDSAGLADDGSARIALPDYMMCVRPDGQNLLEVRLYPMDDTKDQQSAQSLLAEIISLMLPLSGAGEICWGGKDARIDAQAFREIFAPRAPRRIAPRNGAKSTVAQVIPHRPHHTNKAERPIGASPTRGAAKTAVRIAEEDLRQAFRSDAPAQTKAKTSGLSRGLQVAALSGLILALQSSAVMAKASGIFAP